MFGVRNTPPPMASYGDAKRVFDGITPVRGRDASTRPAAHRSNWSLTLNEGTVSRDGQQHHRYALTYYRTNIATFWDDGQIDLEVYPSLSTCRIINSVFDWASIAAHWTADYGRNSTTEVGGYVYNTPRYVSILNGEVVAGAEPFETPRVNRKLLNAALKEVGFDNFTVWLKTCQRINAIPQFKHQWGKADDTGIVALLEQGPEFYMGVLAAACRHLTIDDSAVASIIGTVRIAVTKVYGALDIESRPHLKGRKQLDSHNQARRKWAY